MRAIVIATGHLAPLNERFSAPMLPLVDRPFIQHVVEFFVDQGVTEFDFVLHHLPEKIEHLLGDGSRWGSRFRFHLARDPSRPYRLLKGMGLSGVSEPILFAHADRLPHVQLAQTKPPAQTAAPILFCWRDPSAARIEDWLKWTGWAWLSSRLIARLPDDVDENELASHLMVIAHRKGSLVEVSEPLSAQSHDKLLAAHRRLLAKEFSGLMFTGRETDDGIWLSRNVRLHPTAKLIPPIYIGENCRIGAGVQLRPNTVIGRDCVLDAHCTVENSVIFPGSYVGEALELTDVVVDRDRLINVRVRTAVSVADDFILGSVSDHHIRERLGRLFSRVTAIALLAFTWPVLLVTAVCLKLTRSGPVFYKKEVVRLPAPPDEARWGVCHLWSFCPDVTTEGEGEHRLRDLFLRFLPVLINIARGELRFVGVAPRTKEAIRALPYDWQTLYLRAKAGVITEASVHFGATPAEDELYSAEAFYSVAAGVRHDLKLLIGYFGRTLKTGDQAILWASPTHDAPKSRSVDWPMGSPKPSGK